MKVIGGRTALVTGAASGIGRAIALALAREGANLVLLDVDDENLAQVAGEARALGVAVATRLCDLSQAPQIDSMVADVKAAGPIHILINNAGVIYYGPTNLMSAAQWQEIMAVNLLAPIHLLRELLPVLTAQDEAHVVNVCSIFGLVTLRKGAAYQASKAGLVGLTAALRAEYPKRGFGLTALCPGFVRTPFLEWHESSRPGANVPNWAAISPDVVAARTIRAIRRNEAIAVVPWTARLLWWFARLSPYLLDVVTREAWRR